MPARGGAYRRGGRAKEPESGCIEGFFAVEAGKGRGPQLAGAVGIEGQQAIAGVVGDLGAAGARQAIGIGGEGSGAEHVVDRLQPSEGGPIQPDLIGQGAAGVEAKDGVEIAQGIEGRCEHEGIEGSGPAKELIVAAPPADPALEPGGG